MLHRLLLTAGLALFMTGHAAAEEWNLRIKKDGNSSWSINLTGPQDYGAPGRRIRGSGQGVEKARTVGAFSKLRLEGPMDVRLTQAPADAVRVSADDNVEPLIETVVEGDTLVLRLPAGAGFTTRRAPTVSVDARNLQAVTLNGSGDVSLERFKGDRLELNLSGSGDMSIGVVEVRELNAQLRGSGDLQIAGRAEQQSWTLSGSGDVDARSLAGRTVKAQLHGSGDLDLGVSESLDASVHGSGDLSYAGRPQLKQSVRGSGGVHRR